jgi:hypothetical protein
MYYCLYQEHYLSIKVWMQDMGVVFPVEIGHAA